MNIFKSAKIKRDTKRVFFKKGTCSRAFFYLLNREFGHPLENEEQAADPLAGGIFQHGYQCGIIWGATLALGAESYQRTGDIYKSINMSIEATRHVLNAFVNRAGSPDCLDITDTDWKKKWSILKYMVRGKMFKCYGLADKWAPEAFEAAKEGLALDQSGLPENPVSCASEMVRKMGGSEEEQAIVAGLAGGIGLSGNGCGALAAAIWKLTLEKVREGKYKYTLGDPEIEIIIKEFNEVTEFKIECREICNKEFNSIHEHTEFIKNGGCNDIFNKLGSL